ncbi:hypothetical protein VEV11M_43970 (plasmid) [Escherichia coli]|nr:hypothetical protein VEV11M_43970 [Escherichia coli]
MDWQMSGKPLLLYLDNAAEFKSEAPAGVASSMASGWTIARWDSRTMAGIVERIIGTGDADDSRRTAGNDLLQPDQRGDYDSEKQGRPELRELERWLTLAVGTYHGSVHNGLLQPPAARWAEAVARVGVPAVVTRATSFLVDFLPILRASDLHRLCHRPHPLRRWHC